MPERAADARRGADADLVFAVSPVANAGAWFVLLASIAALLVAAASEASKRFVDEEWKPFGDHNRLVFIVGGSIAAAAFWFLKSYPETLRGTREPGALPPPTELDQGISASWIAFARVAHFFCLGTAAVGATLVLRDTDWLERAVGKGQLGPLLAGVAVLVTSIFVLAAAPHVWTGGDGVTRLSTSRTGVRRAHTTARAERGASVQRAEQFARAFAPFVAIFSAVIGIGMIFGGSESILGSPETERGVLICAGGLLIADAAFGAILARELRPQSEQDEEKAFGKTNRPFGQAPPRRKHA